jgi:hypothetical protein
VTAVTTTLATGMTAAELGTVAKAAATPGVVMVTRAAAERQLWNQHQQPRQHSPGVAAGVAVVTVTAA